jgi:biotin transport system substrate-specific component
VGVPVFSGFTAGVGILAGPTGGYIIGYAAAAFITGLLAHHKSRPPVWLLILGMIFGVLTCYALGTGWFMFVTKNKLAPALSMCVLPFLPGDAAKIVVAALLSRTLEKVTPG